MGEALGQGISTIGSISPMALSLIRSNLCARSVDGSVLSGAFSLVSKLLVFVYNIDITYESLYQVDRRQYQQVKND